MPLSAEPRAESGSVASKRCRASGFVPGVLYGIDEDGSPRKDLIQVPHAEVHRCMTQLERSMVSTVFEVKLGDRCVPAVMRELPLHPTKGHPLQISLLRWYPTVPRASGVKSKGYRIAIPVEHYNVENCPGMRKGNYLNQVSKWLYCTATADLLPSKVMVNLAGRQAGMRILAGHLKFPEGVQPVSSDQMLYSMEGASPMEVKLFRNYIQRRMDAIDDEEYYTEDEGP